MEGRLFSSSLLFAPRHFSSLLHTSAPAQTQFPGSVRKLTFGILKCLSIYDLQKVLDEVPLIQHYNIEHPPEEFNDYIKSFVEKRKPRWVPSKL